MADNVQIQLTKAQANALMELLEDELEDGDPNAPDRKRLEEVTSRVEQALGRLYARKDRMAQYRKTS
jgi:hypothetical protein